jgi:pantoate--beta-alanine ligase
MKTLTRISQMKAVVKKLKSQKKTIAFVPTMGYLHQGHLSLVRKSRQEADITVVSIFVNPAQFGPKEDFARYPRDLKRDSQMLEKERVDYLFVPSDDEMYPQGYKTYVQVLDLQDRLCGRSRPGHFRGVCTVVLKLFNIVQPDVAFFGQKDAQQAIILKKMTEDLDLDVKIRVLPIIRDKDRLALSSRNAYLSQDERKAALVLSKSLKEAQSMVERGERQAGKIVKKMKDIINAEPLAQVDYVEIVDLKNLDPPAKIENKALTAVAVFIGKVRLIDNAILRVKE